MPFIRIVLLSTALAVGYGIVHDQVTARVCIEYFTVGHPPLFPTGSATLLALGWGVVSTWWAGLLLGGLLGLAARVGRRPRLEARDLVKPMLDLVLLLGCLSVVAGILGHRLALDDKLWLVEPLASRMPGHRHPWYIADLWAHTASYAGALVGTVVLSGLTWRRRGKMAAPEIPEETP